MEITSRNLVQQTICFERPRRIPRQIWLLPWATYQYPEEVKSLTERFPDDIITSPGFHKQPFSIVGDPYSIGTYIDEWGCIFENCQRGVIGEVKQPRISSYEQLENFQPPLAAYSVDLELVNHYCGAMDQFIIAGCCPRPFERLQFLRGSVNVFLDLAENLDDLQRLLKIVHEFYLGELEIWARSDVDGLMFMDDWGAQRSLLISPKQWRQLFKPLYQDYIDLAHHYNKYIFMHSDGYIADIIPDLVEIGLDALNSQLFVMDIEHLSNQFAGKITFWGEIDRQHILPANDPHLSHQAVQRVYKAFWRDGGCIAQCEFGAGARPENVFTVFKTWENLPLFG